jgi:hypothetical protein
LTGWQPEIVHRHEYDDAGRMVRTVVEVEPEFDAEQFTIMTALAAYEESLNELGIPRDEAMSVDADPDNPDGLYRYVATGPVRDFAVDAVEQAEKAKAAEYRKLDMEMPGSLRFGVARVERR